MRTGGACAIVIAGLATACGARSGLDAFLGLDGLGTGGDDAGSAAAVFDDAGPSVPDAPFNDATEIVEPDGRVVQLDVCGGLAFQPGATWPSYQRCPFHWGRTEVVVPKNPVLKWSVASPNQGWPPVYFGSGPAIDAYGTIYLTLVDGGVTAISPDGRALWKVQVGINGWYSGSPTVSIARDGSVYVSIDQLYALDPLDGRLRWSTALGPAEMSPSMQTSPAVGPDGTVYAVAWRAQGGASSGLFAIHADGHTAWSSPKLDLLASAAVAKDGSVVFVGDTMGRLHALEPKTGQERWVADIGSQQSEVWMTPTISPDGIAYIGTTSGMNVGTSDGFPTITTFYAIRPDGSALWSHAFDALGYPISGSPALGLDGTIYVLGPDLALNAIAPEGLLRWSVPTNGVEQLNSSYGPILDGDGVSYVITTELQYTTSTLYAVSREGDVAWTMTLDGFANGPPAIGADGTLYAVTSAALYAIGR